MISRRDRPHQDAGANADADTAKEGAAAGGDGAALVVGTSGDVDVDADLWMLSPARFKGLVGRGHSEFSTNKQQDAAEFWSHLRQKLPFMLRKCFEFTEEKRSACAESGEVAYRTSIDNELRLFVPADEEAENWAQVSLAKVS